MSGLLALLDDVAAIAKEKKTDLRTAAFVLGVKRVGEAALAREQGAQSLIE